jgi:hypothetical protein
MDLCVSRRVAIEEGKSLFAGFLALMACQDKTIFFHLRLITICLLFLKIIGTITSAFFVAVPTFADAWFVRASREMA